MPFGFPPESMFTFTGIPNNRAVSADYVQRPDGKYDVELTVEAQKFRADGHGQEHSIPVADLIDIGVLDADGKYLYLQKRKIDHKRTDITVPVEKAPAQAGIDPVDKLIDRNPDDNVIGVKRR